MTPEEFATALTDRLRARGALFRAEDVEGFAAGAWKQGEPPPDPDVWAERFLSDPARLHPVRRQDGWFGRAAFGGIAGCVVGAAACTAITGIVLLVWAQFGGCPYGMESLTYMWLPGGVAGGLLSALLREQDTWLGRAAFGGIAGGLVGAITCTAVLGLFILVMMQFDPSAGMAVVILSFMWLPGGVLGALLGAVLQARSLRRGWLLGGWLGGLLAVALAFTLPFLYFALNVGQYL